MLIIRLLAVIAGTSHNLSTNAEMPSTEEDEVRKSFDYLIACPPIGMKIPLASGWRLWEGFEFGLPGSEAIYKRLAGLTAVQLDRAESWAMAAMWPRIKFRAVFMTGLNLLFAKGQEQRLREFLVIGQQQPMAVVTLPPKLLQFSGIPVALTILDRTNTNGATRFVDSSSMTIESKSTMRFSRQLDSAKLVQAIEREEDIDDVAKSVTLEEIAAQECNLMPARYLKALADDDIDRVPLGELVYEVIRAPVVSKDATAVEVQEVNIPDLGRWGALEGPFLKRTTVQERKLTQCSLLPEDIIISIKGTIGKVGLIGNSVNVNGPLVCGQSVIAIRPNRNIVRPISLYLYLR
ncbi:MAG: N-6 DNA methylase, partial [Pseudohongiella sp.]|nr:N-6 DNA methylase [Pseudohongiella sp.]